MADAYQLLDVGGGARLERFGDRVTDRPYPAALGARASGSRTRGKSLVFRRLTPAGVFLDAAPRIVRTVTTGSLSRPRGLE